MRRALTLIELLLALALLTAFVTAAASWTNIAGLTSAKLARASQFENDAQRVLQLIHDDLVTGDFASGRSARRPRVYVVQGALNIVTRSVPGGTTGKTELGSVTHTYELDRQTSELGRRERHQRNRSETRPLMTGVTDWTCLIDEDLRRLTVSVENARGDTSSRVFALP